MAVLKVKEQLDRLENEFVCDKELRETLGITIRRWPLNEERNESSPESPQEATVSENTLHILLAEDDNEMRTFLAWVLGKKGYKVTECSTGMHLLDNLGSFVLLTESAKFDLIISDIRMPGVTGLEVLEGLHDYEGFPPIILITAFGDEETHLKARRLGAVTVFDKPFELDDLLAKVREVTEYRSINGEEHASVID